MSDATTTGLEHLAALADADRSFAMEEDAFRAFYELTARPLWLYLARATGDPRLADDLLQDVYYRLLRTRTRFASDDHRRFYLFRIAANLIRDHRHRQSRGPAMSDTPVDAVSPDTPTDVAARTIAHIDLTRAMDQLTPRERSLLWLAYGQGCSHEEIAVTHGLRTGSLKVLLYRARRRLLGLLGRPSCRGGRS